MNENTRIADLSIGDEFVGFYALKRCELKEYDGGERVDVELSDSSGSLPGVIWEEARTLHDALNRGDIVKVMGKVGSYRDKPQIRIQKIRPAEKGEFDPESFVPSTPKDVGELTEKLKKFVSSITDPHLSLLAREIFGMKQFMAEFTRSPGGKKWHHPYLGGLLEHTVGVAEICDDVARRRPELNRDLLVMGALVHDVGKIREFSASTTIEYTDEGRLEGHIVIGERFVRNMCDRVDGFPPKLRMLLSHLVLSHQGFKEFSTPVEPMIPEGFVLYYADEMDSKLNALSRIVADSRESDDNWSDYIRNLSRFIFVGRDDLPDE